MWQLTNHIGRAGGRWAISLPLAIFLLYLPAGLSAQQAHRLSQEMQVRLEQLVMSYEEFYMLLTMDAEPDPDRFTALFVSNRVPLYNDYYDAGTMEFGSPINYCRDIVGLFYKNHHVINDLEIEVTYTHPVVAYWQRGYYNVWLRKKITYRITERTGTIKKNSPGGPGYRFNGWSELVSLRLQLSHLPFHSPTNPPGDYKPPPGTNQK